MSSPLTPLSTSSAGRSLSHLIETIAGLEAKGVGLREAAARLKIGKTALYAGLRDVPTGEPGEAALMEGTR